MRCLTFTLIAVLAAGCHSSPKQSRGVGDLRSTRPAPTYPESWTVIGSSVEGRNIRAITFGRGALRVLVIGSIHGDEAEGLAVIDDLREALDTPELRNAATFRMIRDVNPDGSLAGSRTNAHGVDLNRNWDASNFRPGEGRGAAPLSEPETRAAHAALLAFGPDLIVVFHSTGRGPFVNHDPPDASEIASVFSRAAAVDDARWRVVGDMGYETPGSLGSYAGLDLRIPILTIEFKRGQDKASTLRAARAGINAVVRGMR